ncbi:hypothetical protein FJT64_001117 [Amphibalanus amphitrite]|uniref:Uncharacterized protein n=1 Tax=Amphibalanus amphitrite TaxID=1232801 RepID=A0A6A4VM36_AMPAM|nr:hypothetical protein FJT64_001117 [Amphibalanus amphitrite]
MKGCGEMEYCTGGSNGKVCTNKRGVNQACEHSVQCISGSCRHGKCRNDACPMIDTSIDCMPTQYCTSSPQGHMCVSKKENGARCAVSTHCQSGVCEHGACVQDDCWKPFTQDRCQTSHYCSPGTKGHTCEMKRMLGASCRFDVQCKSHMCRHRMCMTDKCSVPLSTDRCDVTTEFCQAGPTGNMCVTKLMDMTSCKVNVQCMSGRCENGMCMPKTPGKKPIGAACMMHTECETMWCVVGKCSGHVCATGSPGGTRCVPQSADGGPCTTGFQCVSGVCRDNVCGRREECSVTSEGTSDCPLGQQCVLTSRGYRCQLGSDRCPRPFSSLGCNRNQYCTTSSSGNICTEKQPVDARCTDPIECLSGTCRNNRCKQDACPMVDTSIDCMPTQYCSPGERGNMCVAKKEARARCSASQQCLSNVCERGVCVEDECPNPYMSDRCLPSQFCSPAPRGNMCMEKRDTNARCQRDIECMSNTCFNQRCVTNQCTTPFLH